MKHISLESHWNFTKSGIYVTRPGDEQKGNFALSYSKLLNFMKQFNEVGGKLRNLPKSEPWLNCIGIVDAKMINGKQEIVRQAMVVYVWDTKKIVGIVNIPITWYLVNKNNPKDMHDFLSLFVTKFAVRELLVVDPIPGPDVKSF